MRTFIFFFFLVSCSVWDNTRLVELRFAPGCAAWVSAPPEGTLCVGTLDGGNQSRLVYGQPTAIRASSLSSGWAVWKGPAGEPLGAVWTTPPESVLLDAHGGFIASVLERCSRQGAPVWEWDLAAVLEAFRETASSRPPVFWDADQLAADLLAGRQGPGLFRLLERRSVDVVLPEGVWVPEWSGLPNGSGEWPLGLWSLADSTERLWVQIAPTGPVLLRRETRA